MDLYDVIIVGGGPAGLNAAVVLGRARRRVIVFDTGRQRNRLSHGMHNYLTRDGILPTDFLDMARKEILHYGVGFFGKSVKSVEKKDNGLFRVTAEDRKVYYSKKILIATGLQDTIPEVEGIREMYGKSVFHCPYCDGWEVRDKKIALYARNKNGFELALALKTWSPHITYLTDGRRYLNRTERDTLDAYGISIIHKPIRKLQGRKGQITSVLFTDGDTLPADAMFFVNGYSQQCSLVEELGCILSPKKVVITNKVQQTNIEGVYVAGDAARDMHFVVVAAAEGAKAGVTINKELQKEEKKKILTSRLPA